MMDLRLFILVLLQMINVSVVEPKKCLSSANITSQEFIDNIFTKYGHDGTISSNKFNKLIENLGIGKMREPTQGTKTKREVTKRTGGDNTKVCLQSEKILTLNSLGEQSGVTKDQFLTLCPTLIQQIDNKICIEEEDHGDEDEDEDDDHEGHDHEEGEGHDDDDDDHEGHSHGPKEMNKVWGYGFASITIISVLCLSVIAVIPCLQKSFYNTIMSFLVALAVGTLCGDAMLHLIPHAFLEGANDAANMTVDGKAEIAQHYALVHRALFALAGMYAFFMVEQVMTLRGGSSHGHSHGGDSHSHGNQKDDYDRSESKKGLMREESSFNATNEFDDNKVVGREDSLENGKRETGKESGDEVGGHVEVATKTSEMSITSVAWMVMVGDGFHNFSDGLAVGAAFSSSTASGISTSIAIFCHELPHELGDFAILLRNGMTVKQALIYNVTSAFLAYLGLIVGVLAGEYAFGRHLILSITAGLFLYVSLVDMLPELMRVPKHSKLATFLCQHLGLITGVSIMLIISIYEHQM